MEGHVKLRDGKKVPRSRRPFGTGGPDRRPPRPAGGGASPLSPPPALPNPVLFASRCSGRVGGWCCASPPRWQVRAGRRRGAPGCRCPPSLFRPTTGWGTRCGVCGAPLEPCRLRETSAALRRCSFSFFWGTHAHTQITGSAGSQPGGQK